MMNTIFVALVWVFAVGTCVSVAVVLVTITLALRHRRQLTKGKLGILREHPITIPRSLTMADLLVAPRLRAELRWWVRIQGKGPVEQPSRDDIRRD
jgi:hypothetical protein